jgi:phosphate-selective porin OprO/OprP
LISAAVIRSQESGYEDGFFIKSKNAKFTIEGLLQVNGSIFESNSPRDNGYELRRMRLEFSGEFYDRWLFHIEPKFVAGGVEFEEAWVGFKIRDHKVMIGRMKEPFELEEMLSQRHMDPINFSILNQFVPAEDHGITVFGNFGILEYGAGIYDGSGSDKIVSDEDIAFRLVIHPWQKLQFGGSITKGHSEGDVSGKELKTEARVPWTTFRQATEIDGGITRYGLELAFLEGPFALTLDTIHINERIQNTPITLKGGYVQASYVLTGEEKSFKGVKPANPFLKDPAIGAWQLVARLSMIKFDDRISPFLTNFTDEIDTFLLGVVWYTNDFVKFKLNYIRTNYKTEIAINNSRFDRENMMLVQFQLQF